VVRPILATLVALLAVAPAARAADGVPASSHVFVIVGENTSLSQITPAHAPYLTQTLRPRAAWLTHYSSFPKSSSLGQYMALTSGQFTKCEANNDLPSARCHQRIGNLFSQLDRTGRGWFDWEESMTNACDIFDSGSAWSKNIYSAHHNPALYYTRVEGGRYDEAIAPSAECRTRDVSMGTTAPNDTSALDAALASGDVGSFDLLVPNDCENGHDPCGTRDPVRQFDDFLAREVPKIESSPAFGADSVIFITWDEGADPPKDPKHVLTLAVGPQVRPGTYTGAYDHYSLLRTVEDALGLPPLAHARQAHAFAGMWAAGR
jgi:phosphatidylinositol-3-phosphatase